MEVIILTYDNESEEALKDIAWRLEIEAWIWRLQAVGLAQDLN